MRMKEWLMDLAENNRVDMLNGEIVILPIKEDDEDENAQKEKLLFGLLLLPLQQYLFNFSLFFFSCKMKVFHWSTLYFSMVQNSSTERPDR